MAHATSTFREGAYAEAVARAWNRKKSFAAARPHSAILLAYGTSYVYEQAVLCCSFEQTVRILDVYNAGQNEIVIDVKQLLLDDLGGWVNDEDELRLLAAHPFELRIIHYENETVTFLISDLVARALVTINTRERIFMTGGQNRVRFCHLELYPGDLLRGPTFNLRAIHSEKLLHWARASLYDDQQGLYRWNLYRMELDIPLTKRPPVMTNLFRTHLGQSLDFKRHDDYIYILSNQSELEWAGDQFDYDGHGEFDYDEDRRFPYQCYRFPINDLSAFRIGNSEKSSLAIVRIHRPLPKAEPSHNLSWIDLKLHASERTGKLSIIEYIQDRNYSGSMRGYYDFQPLIFPEAPKNNDPQYVGPHDHLRTPPVLVIGNPQDNIGSGRRVCTFEMEDAPIGQRPHDHSGYNKDTTGYRAYNPSAFSFLDMTLDKFDLRRSQKASYRQKVNLRIGSRAPKSPLDGRTGHLPKPSIHDDEQARQSSKRQGFVDRGINSWPPKNAPSELFALLNPFGDQKCGFRASSDERSIIYKIGHVHQAIKSVFIDDYEGGEEEDDRGERAKSSGNHKQERRYAIIFVNFDAHIDYPGLEEMHLSALGGPNVEETMAKVTRELHRLTTSEDDKDKGEGKAKEETRQEERPDEQHGVEEEKQEEGAFSDDDRWEEGVEPSWFRREPAMWTRDVWGYRFTYKQWSERC